MKFPVPIAPLGAVERQDLAEAIREAGAGGMDLPHLSACLWLHFCHLNHVRPDVACAGRPGHGSITKEWAPVLAKLTRQCSHAITVHHARSTASMADTLLRDTRQAQATAGVSSPSLF